MYVLNVGYSSSFSHTLSNFSRLCAYTKLCTTLKGVCWESFGTNFRLHLCGCWLWACERCTTGFVPGRTSSIACTSVKPLSTLTTCVCSSSGLCPFMRSSKHCAYTKSIFPLCDYDSSQLPNSIHIFDHQSIHCQTTLVKDVPSNWITSENCFSFLRISPDY